MAESFRKILKAISLILIIIATAKAYELLEPINFFEKFDGTLNIEAYIGQVERQYDSQFENNQGLVTDFQKNYERQLSSVDFQRVLIETELRAIDQKLYPLEFLSNISKHCVQKNRKYLYTVTDLRTNFANCINLGRNSLKPILSTAENNIKSMNALYKNNFKNGIIECEHKYENDHLNHTECIVDLIQRLGAMCNNLQRSFIINLDAARCSADMRVRQTMECTFRLANASLSSIGVTKTLISDCFAGIEKCSNCPKDQCATAEVSPLSTTATATETPKSDLEITTTPATSIYKSRQALKIKQLNTTTSKITATPQNIVGAQAKIIGRTGSAAQAVKTNKALGGAQVQASAQAEISSSPGAEIHEETQHDEFSSVEHAEPAEHIDSIIEEGLQ